MAAPLPPDPGWYRLGDHGWEHVPDADALAAFAAMTPGYEQLTYFEHAAPMVEDPLW